MLSDSFYEYARLSRTMRMRLGYRGVKVLQPQVGSWTQVGDGTAVFSDDFVAADMTTAFVSPVVNYPQVNSGYDLPGGINGPAINVDNSLSIPSWNRAIGAPLTAVLACAAHTANVEASNSIVFSNIPTEYQNEAVRVFAFAIKTTQIGNTAVATDLDMNVNQGLNALQVPMELYTNSARLDEDVISMRYRSDRLGTLANATDKAERWDGSVIFTFVTYFPDAASGTFNGAFRTTITTAGTYRIMLMGVDPVDLNKTLFRCVDDFEVS